MNWMMIGNRLKLWLFIAQYHPLLHSTMYSLKALSRVRVLAQSHYNDPIHLPLAEHTRIPTFFVSREIQRCLVSTYLHVIETTSTYIMYITHCLYLVLNTQETSHFYWHQFWDKNDDENICHWNYFQIPRALSELPANWPGRFSQKGWLGLAS